MFRPGKRDRICYLSLLVLGGPAISRLSATQNADASQSATVNDFQHRLEAEMEARKSGDPIAISRASKQVIALALAELARLRLDDKAYEQAAKLCQQSLEYEDSAETRVELAIASFYAKKPSEAEEQAAIATAMDPQNALAWNIKGEALLQKKDYAGAVTALARALELKHDAESTYALGMAYLGLEEKEKAAESFSQMLAITGDHGWSRVLVGRAYQEAYQEQEAEHEFRTALQLDPRTPNAHFLWGLSLLQVNEWNFTPEIRTHLQDELRLNPRHFQANYLLGSSASLEKNYDQSDRYLKLAATSNPAVPETFLYLGLNAQGRKDIAAAEGYFRKAIALANKLDPKAHLSMRQAYIGLGRILLSSGRTNEGEEMMKKARELQFESFAESQKKIAAMNARGGAGVGGAVVPYLPETPDRDALAPAPVKGPKRAGDSAASQRPVPSSPQEPIGKAESHLRALLGSNFNDLATAEALQEKYDLAINHYHEALNWDPAVPGLDRNLGLASYFVGEYKEAIRLLSKVMQTAPNDEHTRAVLGMTYFETNAFTKAAQTISPIAARALQDPQLGYAWAKSLAETGNKNEAARVLKKLEQSDLNLNTRDLTQYGQLWAQLGNRNLAEQSLRRAVQIDPGSVVAKCALGAVLLEDSRPREAAELLQSVVSDHPENAEAQFQLGQALLELGDLPNSIQHLEEAARLQPDRLPIHVALETAYRKAGRTEEAQRESRLCESLRNRQRTPKGSGRGGPQR